MKAAEHAAPAGPPSKARDLRCLLVACCPAGSLALSLKLPHLFGRLIAQMLMQANLVVPVLKLIKQALQMHSILDVNLVELLLQRAK